MTVTQVDSGFSKKTNGKAFGWTASAISPFFLICLYCCVSIVSVLISVSVQYLLLRMRLFPNFLSFSLSSLFQCNRSWVVGVGDCRKGIQVLI